MTRVVDLHPEELLDRDARGELTAADQTRLQAHLARCAACRFERQVRADFADELAGDEDDGSLPSVERLALLGTSLPSPTSPPKRAPVSEMAPKQVEEASLREDVRAPAARRMARASWLLVAAALLAVSVAGASDAGHRAWSRILGEPSPFVPNVSEETEGPGPSHATTKHAPRRAAVSAPPPAASETSVTSPAPDAVGTVAPPPALVVAQPAPATPAAAAPVAARHSTSSIASRTTSGARLLARSETAASLFDAAADARRQGSYARAIDLQRQLLSRYPASREAHVARETLGRLLLDRGDPAGAVSSFDAYLSEGAGELGEEAMVGRATALERLGRSAQASDAWRALLAAYPETAYAAHARSRLGSLSVR